MGYRSKPKREARKGKGRSSEQHLAACSEIVHTKLLTDIENGNLVPVSPEVSGVTPPAVMYRRIGPDPYVKRNIAAVADWNRAGEEYKVLTENPPSIEDYAHFIRRRFAPAYNRANVYLRKGMCLECGRFIQWKGSKPAEYCDQTCQKKTAYWNNERKGKYEKRLKMHIRKTNCRVCQQGIPCDDFLNG